MEHDEKLNICHALQIYGGGFDKIFSELLIVADENNLKKLVSTFPEIIEKGRYMYKFFLLDKEEK